MCQLLLTSGNTLVQSDSQLCQDVCHNCKWLVQSKLPLTLLFEVTIITCYAFALLLLLLLLPLVNCSLITAS